MICIRRAKIVDQTPKACSWSQLIMSLRLHRANGVWQPAKAPRAVYSIVEIHSRNKSTNGANWKVNSTTVVFIRNIRQPVRHTIGLIWIKSKTSSANSTNSIRMWMPIMNIDKLHPPNDGDRMINSDCKRIRYLLWTTHLVFTSIIRIYQMMTFNFQK